MDVNAITVRATTTTRTLTAADLPADFTTAVAAAVNAMHASGITGWGLYNPPYGLEPCFTRHQIDGGTGCTSDTCAHSSHDSFSYTYKWVPCAGVTLVDLGSEPTGTDGDQDTYYMVIIDPAIAHASHPSNTDLGHNGNHLPPVCYLRLTIRQYFHAYVTVLSSVAQVPTYLLANLAVCTPA